MLTSIRGLSAATLSMGLLVTAAPAFAEESTAGETTIVNEELVAASAALDAKPVLSTSDRAIEPINEAEANKVAGESGLSFSANVAFATEYRFRGVGLSDGEFAIQGGFDVSHSSGLYVGTWASNIDEQTVGFGSTEVDLYGGWSGDVGEGISTDVGVIYYLFPDAPGVAGNTDYIEFYGSLSFSLASVSVTPGIAYAPDQDSLGDTDNLYLYTDVSFGIPDTPITLNGHIGYTDGFLTFTNDSEAFDWSVSADYALNDTFTISAAYIGVEGDAANDLIQPDGDLVFTGDAFVATLSASF
ncbi:TorF family putative porin [uncultured Erythrobacter sp.]|uniref:TorF family putative porin n=1 Tax=uncultured Erythrobacter sp. TaxID=263913 RepID=UPI00260B009A|nr:TorF family putative porin [uncultured Erythrobacter sp.]